LSVDILNEVKGAPVKTLYCFGSAMNTSSGLGSKICTHL